jgi:hypothetical protein
VLFDYFIVVGLTSNVDLHLIAYVKVDEIAKDLASDIVVAVEYDVAGMSRVS